MYFDFEDHRPDTPQLPRSMSTREVVLITVNLHLLFLVAILLGPRLPFVQKILLERQQAQEAERQRQLEEQQKERARFVFMAPRVETPPQRPPQRPELSDMDRSARTVERAPDPKNDMPFSRGNTTERMVAEPPARGTPEAPPQPEPEPDPSPAEPAPPLPDSTNGFSRPQEPQETRGPAAGVLADAIRNARRYAQSESFNNLQGGRNNQFGPAINFDAKGVEFGPWIARFVAQVRRNWFIPMAAMTMRGHVVVTFNVHKDGRITDVTVLKPSTVEAFTLSARNAILASNPTVPLPPEYPDDKAFFTVTFYFNEIPGAP